MTTWTLGSRHGRSGLDRDLTADKGQVATLARAVEPTGSLEPTGSVSSPNQYQDVGRVSRPLS